MKTHDRMRVLVDALPEMLEQAWKAEAPDRFALEEGRVVLLGGMGGSGMAAALGAELLQKVGRPAVAWRHPRLPDWLGSEDRIVIVSYSGSTWESLEMFENAQTRSVPTRVIGSGGPLLEKGRGAGQPVFQVPTGLPPRASLPWLCVGVARATDCLRDEEISSAVELLRDERGHPERDRDPVRLAAEIDGCLTILLPIGPAMEQVALRWSQQILENAEQYCIVSSVPEAAHNAIMGWPWLKKIGVPLAFLVLADSWPLTGRWKLLLRSMESEAGRLGHSIRFVRPRPGNGFGSLLSGIYLGDRVSVELAERRGIAATPVPAIERLKASMERKPRP